MESLDDINAALTAIERMEDAQIGPHVTCPASRHVSMIAEDLARFGSHTPVVSHPRNCASSMAATVQALWDARAELTRLKGKK